MKNSGSYTRVITVPQIWVKYVIKHATRFYVTNLLSSETSLQTCLRSRERNLIFLSKLILNWRVLIDILRLDSCDLFYPLLLCPVTLITSRDRRLWNKGKKGSFIRLVCEYEIECEYDIRISNQWRFQSPRSLCSFHTEQVAHGMK